MHGIIRSATAIVAVALSASVAAGQGVTWHAFASLSDVYNANRPGDKRNDGRVFDFDDNRLRLDDVELSVARAVSKAGAFGFRVDLEAGRGVPRVAAASGLFRDANTGHAKDVDLKQAYVSYGLRGGWRADAGKFVTPLGLEVIEGWDGYNDNASRSFLFGYAIPFTHTGVRLNYGGSRASGIVMLVNGWDNVKDNNLGKTAVVQLSVTPAAPLMIAVSGITGPEQTAEGNNHRTVFDIVATLKLSSTSTLGFNADLGDEGHAALDGGQARWRGAAGYARLGVTPKFSLCLRGEHFSDPDGARTGVAQQMSEFTLTPELRLSSHVLVRADLRKDQSNRPVFDAHDGIQRSQFTTGINLLLVF